MGKKRIVIVDDDRLMLDFYKEVLADSDYDCTYCSSPFGALNEIFRQPYDLIITDQKMPMKSGSEMIGFIREAMDGQQVPVIVVSANLSDQLANDLKEFPDVSLLKKPVDQEVLLAEIQKKI